MNAGIPDTPFVFPFKNGVRYVFVQSPNTDSNKMFFDELSDVNGEVLK